MPDAPDTSVSSTVGALSKSVSSLRQPKSRRYIGFWCLCLLVFPPGFAAKQALAQEPDLLSKVKTAYLFNIAKFVSWPDVQADVVLCVDPTSRLKPYLQQLHQRNIGDQRKLLVVVTLPETTNCQMYFSERPFKDQESSALTAVSTLVQDSPTAEMNHILTVSDHQDSLRLGYIMQLKVEGDRLRFRYNPEALAESSFIVSSKLRSLARR